MKIISIVGARPNFMKTAPIHKAIEKFNSTNQSLSAIDHLICHTGQHYNENMSKIFFGDLELPEPNFYLGVGSGSHAEQTARIMIEFEKVLISEKPDLIIVVGDVNSTIACSLTAAKMGIKIAHIEAGLRSFDREMPEELNRLLTDQLADYLFVTEQSGIDNLLREGISKDKIFFVGNVMIDSLVHYLPKTESSNIFRDLKLIPNSSTGKQPLIQSSNPTQSSNPSITQSSSHLPPYILITLHRPSNVDDPDNLKQIISTLNHLAEHRKVIFPVHPRTIKNLNDLSIQEFNNTSIHSNLTLTDPIGYIDFLALIKNAELVITDSGGIQEETTFLGVQCITVRNNTERPATVDIGTNQLIGTDLKKVEAAAMSVLNGKVKQGRIPEMWDGQAAERIVEILAREEFGANRLQ